MCSNGNGVDTQKSAAQQLPTFDELVYGYGQAEESPEPYTPKHAK